MKEPDSTIVLIAFEDAELDALRHYIHYVAHRDAAGEVRRSVLIYV